MDIIDLEVFIMVLDLHEGTYDIAIVGCGPAGYSAAINAKIRNKTFIILGSEVCAEKTLKSPQIDNYLGFTSTPGPVLREKFEEHLQEMGITVDRGKVTTIYPQGDVFGLQVKTDMILAKTVIITTGVTFGKLLVGEAEFLGMGVSYCATCDGPLYRGKDVTVIAYTEEAEEEAAYLAEICNKVYYVQQYKELKRTFADNVEIIKEKPLKISGAMNIEVLELEKRNLKTDGIFVIRKAVGPGQLVPGLELDENHIKVNRQQETNIPGLYAAGDITGKPYQIAKAVGEGLVAALAAVAHLDKK